MKESELIIKAEVAEVKMGYISIEGLRDENKQYYVGVPQIAEQFNLNPNQASREISTLINEDFQFLNSPTQKRLKGSQGKDSPFDNSGSQKRLKGSQGKDSPFDKKTSKEFVFIKAKTKLNSKAVNVLTIEQFEQLLVKLDRVKSNTVAQNLRDSLAGMSLQQLFADAFNDKFEQEERQDFLKARQEGIMARLSLTDSIKFYQELHPELSEEYKKWIWSRCTNAIYSHVLGCTAAEAKKLYCSR